MDLQNSFVVPSDIDTAWKTLQDVEGLAPCMPGATLDSVDGDSFTGSVKVKLGPVSMVYGGVARFVSRDDATHTAVIEGSGKETRGTGTAQGQVTATLVARVPTARGSTSSPTSRSPARPPSSVAASCRTSPVASSTSSRRTWPRR